MLDAKCYDFCNGVYVVEKSVEVVVKIGGEDRRIRIDALHHVRESTIRYSTRAYIEEAITVQPTFPPKELEDLNESQRAFKSGIVTILLGLREIPPMALLIKLFRI